MKRKVALLNILFFLLTSPVLAFNAELPNVEQSGDLVITTNNPNLPEDINTYINEEENKASIQAVYPSQYDLRETTGLPEIRNQNPYGTCWAFAPLASIESNLIKKGSSRDIDLSESSIVWFAGNLRGNKKQREGRITRADNLDRYLLSCGGNFNDTTALLTTWQGSNDESSSVYPSYLEGLQVSNDLLDEPTYHVQQAESLYSPLNTEDMSYHKEIAQTNINKIKRMVMDNGAVAIGHKYPFETEYVNPQTKAVYINTPTTPDHGVSIIGWDDSYPVTNFNNSNEPEEPGAWLVRNSWGEDQDDNGYFYLSYYDQSIITPYSYSAELPENYSYENLYLYDYLGDQNNVSYIRELAADYVNAPIKVANVFNSEGEETLKAVSAYTSEAGGEVDISVYQLTDVNNPESGTLLTTQHNSLSNKGYYTINLNEEINLNKGAFAIVESIYYPTLNRYDFPVEYGFDLDEVNYVNGNFVYVANNNAGESFINLPINESDSSWHDLNESDIKEYLSVSFDGVKVKYYPGNAFIRAYTSAGSTGKTVSTEASDPNKLYILNLNARPYNCGSVIGSGSYKNHSVVTISAHANNGYEFDGWYENGNSVSKDLNYTFEIQSDKSLTARFKQVDTGIPIYRVYDPNRGEHLYTSSKKEAEILCTTGWQDEGVGWYAPQIGVSVYRLYNNLASDHLYTLNDAEISTLLKTQVWCSDFNGTPLFYSGGNVSIYRLYNPNNGRHHFTTNEEEYNILGTLGWNQEGIKMYGLK